MGSPPSKQYYYCVEKYLTRPSYQHQFLLMPKADKFLSPETRVKSFHLNLKISYDGSFTFLISHDQIGLQQNDVQQIQNLGVEIAQNLA